MLNIQIITDNCLIIINLDKSKICLKCFDDERFSSVIKKMQLILTLSAPKELDLYYIGGGGQGSGRPGEKGAGGVREAGEEAAGSGIPKVAGSRRKREKLRKIAQYFAIEKIQRGGSQKIQGREPGLKGTGSGRFKPPCPPPPYIGPGKLFFCKKID